MTSARIRRAVPVASAAIAVVVVIVAGAGVTGAWQRMRQNVVGPAASPSAQSEAVVARANSVFEPFNGTVQQRDASGVVQAWALNGAMDTCMDRHGFPQWDWSRTRNVAPRTNALDTSLFFAAPLSRAYSNALMDMADSVRIEEQLRTEEVTKDETDAASMCLETTPAESDDAASAASTPPGVARLRDQWWSMLTSLDERYGDVDAYNQCFARAATSLAVNQTSGDSWKADLTTLAPRPKDIPIAADDDPLATNDAWLKFVATEDAIERVDWGCRESVYENHLGDLDAAINSFATEHATDIQAAQAAWVQVEDAAAKLEFRDPTLRNR